MNKRILYCGTDNFAKPSLRIAFFFIALIAIAKTADAGKPAMIVNSVQITTICDPVYNVQCGTMLPKLNRLNYWRQRQPATMWILPTLAEFRLEPTRLPAPGPPGRGPRAPGPLVPPDGLEYLWIRCSDLATLLPAAIAQRAFSVASHITQWQPLYCSTNSQRQAVVLLVKPTGTEVRHANMDSIDFIEVETLEPTNRARIPNLNIIEFLRVLSAFK